MSSTNRGYDRHKSDYYITPPGEIYKFLLKYERAYAARLPPVIFDPSAGGARVNDIPVTPMSYPEALYQAGYADSEVFTNDIREDSPADLHMDYLEMAAPEVSYGTIITNPPFSLAVEFTEKALDEARVVIVLQRLNWLGSKKRKAFWDENPPTAVFVHHERMSFTNNGETDSIEYAHFVWDSRFGYNTRLWVI